MAVIADTAERYLSTPLFSQVSIDMDEEPEGHLGVLVSMKSLQGTRACLFAQNDFMILTYIKRERRSSCLQEEDAISKSTPSYQFLGKNQLGELDGKQAILDSLDLVRVEIELPKLRMPS